MAAAPRFNFAQFAAARVRPPTAGGPVTRWVIGMTEVDVAAPGATNSTVTPTQVGAQTRRREFFLLWHMHAYGERISTSLASHL